MSTIRNRGGDLGIIGHICIGIDIGLIWIIIEIVRHFLFFFLCFGL